MDKRELIKNGMKYQFKNEATEDTHILTLSGAVGAPDILDLIMDNETINAKDIKGVLDDVDTDIHIKINSGGGDVFEGIEIYNYLKNHDSHITVEVTALAASAASIIAMAGDKVVMDTGASMMIHEASTIAFGNKAEITKALNALETIDGSLSDIYSERTGISTAELDDLLTSETWLTADEAVSQGFADKKLAKQKPEPKTDDKQSSEKVAALEQKVASLEGQFAAMSQPNVKNQRPRRRKYL